MTTAYLGVDERLGLHVVDATETELRAIEHQTGLRRTALRAAPRLTLRFVDELPLSEPLRLVGADTGCTADAVVMLPGGPRLLVPVLSLGGPTELLCEHGASTVPLLLDLLNVSALAAGLLPLHAGAFVLDGVGTVVTGWSKGGKTETVLGVMTGRSDAVFVGDEWIYVDPMSRAVLGSQHPVRVWGWQVEQLDALRSRLSRKDLRRFRVIRAAERRHASMSNAPRRRLPAKLLNAVMPLLRSRHGAYVEPADLYGPARVRAQMTVDRLVHVESGSSDRTWATAVDAAAVAERMTWSLRHERRELSAAYDAFRYVHPSASNAWLDALDGLERDLLAQAFTGVPAVEVRHPYPVDIAALADTVVGAIS